MLFKKFALLMTLAAGLASAVTAQSQDKPEPVCQPDTVSVQCGQTPSSVWHDDRFWVAFVHGNHVYVSWTRDGNRFSEPVPVNIEPEVIDSNGESRPKIAFTDAAMLISWTQKTSERYTGAVRYSRSTNQGKTFEEPRTINPNFSHISQRFDSLTVSDNGRVYLAWLDKQQSAQKDASEPRVVSSLYYAVSQDHGKTFSKGYKIADNSCECCRLATAPASSGGLAVLWRHIYPGSIRDHAFAQVSPQGKTLSFAQATLDDWQIEACPHHGPAMATSSATEYHLAWFTNGRERTGIHYGLYEADTGQLRYVRAMDTTAGASHPQVVKHAELVYFAWKRFDGTSTRVQLAISADDGRSWTDIGSVAQTQGASDHPLLVSTPTGVYLSWQTRHQGLRLQALSDPATLAHLTGPIITQFSK